MCYWFRLLFTFYVNVNVAGYVLTENSNLNCLKRRGEEAVMVKCDKGYSTLSLQCKI